MAKIHTHYDNLKCARNATDSTIKNAYKALCQTYHPDKFQGSNAEAERIMKLINSAYMELRDPVKRAEHDDWIQTQETEANKKQEAEVNKKRGWVYIFTNKAMPNLLKVGFTTRDPEQRANDLHTTGVPHRFVVEYDALVNEAFRVEQKAHTILKHCHENKEWFRCNIATAIAAIRQAANGEIILENNRHEKNAYIEAELRKIEQEKANAKAREEVESNARAKAAADTKARLDYERIEREKQEKEANRQRIDKETRETLSENFIGLWGISIVIGCLLLGSFSAGSFLLAAIVLIFNYLSSKSSKDSAIELRKSFSLVDLKLQEEFTRKEREFAEKQRKTEQSSSGWVFGFIGLAVVITVASLEKRSNTANNTPASNPPTNITSVKPAATVKSLEVIPVTTQNASTPIAENIIGCVVGNCTNEQGTYTFENGDKYIGKFKNGQINGKGTYFYANGTITKGKWTNGQLTNYQPRQSSPTATKQTTKARERATAQEQVREEVQTQISPKPLSLREQVEADTKSFSLRQQAEAQVREQVQEQTRSKPLSLREQAEADSKSFSLRQQAIDERQRTETQVQTENHAERYDKYMQDKNRRDRDANFQRLSNY